MSGSFICYICSSAYPVEFLNKHHKVPSSLGGKDTEDNLLSLCAGCHQFTHAIARMMRNPKRAGEVRTFVQSTFPDGKAQFKCIELAKLECKSKIENQHTLAADISREIKISLKVTKPYRDGLQLIARDRKLSMSNYVRKLVEDHVRQIYPQIGEKQCK